MEPILDKRYYVTLAYRPDGSGSATTIPIYARSEFHAMQLAQSRNPDMYAVSAAPR